jgi:hypothetical protein
MYHVRNGRNKDVASSIVKLTHGREKASECLFSVSVVVMNNKTQNIKFSKTGANGNKASAARKIFYMPTYGNELNYLNKH